MTYEEALKWFKDDMSDGMCSTDCPQCNANMLAIEALEKQIAKKPIDNHHCPSCETGLPHRGITDEWCKCCFDPDYCPECGQAIDWGADEET